VGSERFKMEDLGEVTILHFHFVQFVARGVNWDFG
jgi:hypothetical protein